MKVPIHKSFELIYNDHASYYETAEYNINNNKGMQNCWLIEAERQLAIDTNTIWKAQVYINVSNDPPYGEYYYLCAATLEGILARLSIDNSTEYPTSHVDALRIKCVTLYLTHNEWTRNSSSLLEEFSNLPEIYDDDFWVSLEDKEKSLKDNEVWSVQWYPDTPIGFYTLHANSLDALLVALKSNT